MIIEIYSRPNCPFCTKAEHVAQQLVQETSDNRYSKFMLDVDFTREELFEKFPKAPRLRTFPQITVDGEAVGGYDNFVTLLEGK